MSKKSKKTKAPFTFDVTPPGGYKVDPQIVQFSVNQQAALEFVEFLKSIASASPMPSQCSCPICTAERELFKQFAKEQEQADQQSFSV